MEKAHSQMETRDENSEIIGLELGVKNLLRNCIKIEPGQKLLIVGETGDDAYYDDSLCSLVQQGAEKIGAISTVLWLQPVKDATALPTILSEQMALADAVVLFSRVGDQTRFTQSPGKGKKVMCYTLTKAHLGAPFASIDHRKMTQILNLLESNLRQSTNYRIQTPDGTDLCGEIIADGERGSSEEFYVELFPVMIFEPIICHNVSGTLTVSRFITSTSTRAYEQSELLIDCAISALVENSKITGMDGDTHTIFRIEQQLERAARLTGGDPFALNSWHTGVNPGTFFQGDPFDNLERWGTVAYGSPRFTHIHGAGHNPGDVAYNLMDATIWFDDKLFWLDGRFVFLERPDVQSMLTPEEQSTLNSRFHLDIGI